MVIKTSAARWCRLTGGVAFALAVLTTAGCGSSASSVVSQAGSEAGSLASSASSAASSALAKVKGGLDAKADVSAGPGSVGSDGKATCQLTVTNPTSETHDYTISVEFDNANGDLQDAVVVSVSNVPASGTANATARSNRTLSGPLTAKIVAALRH